jgi:uncharacterized membrane protein YdbT with pleckstrin-like domain
MLQRRVPYIPDGRSKGRHPSDFDPVQLAIGTKVEMEHTTDRRVAQRIAMDHLTEDRSYYKKLAKIHLDESRHTRRRDFGDATCSTSPRWVRGSVGLLIGGVLGSMIGGGIALAVTTSQFEITAPVEALARAKTLALVATGITVLGAVGGLMIGAQKPEC